MRDEPEDFDDAPTARLVSNDLLPRCPHCGETMRNSGDSSFTDSDPSGVKHVLTATKAGVPLQIGHAFGPFLLQEFAGRGTFGTVWKAKQIDLNRIVALKIPHKSWLENESFSRRLDREAQAAAALSHPNILDLLDFKTIDGLPVIVTKYITGVNLEQWLGNHKPTFQEAAEWVAQLAEALEYVHQQKIVHRDVKPSNVMLVGSDQNRQRTPILIDFGLALRDDESSSQGSQVLGTPAYMSPEQATRGRKAVDWRSDIYSLGVLLYRMTTGVLPHLGSPEEIIERVRTVEPKWPRMIDRTIPRDLETIILHAMAREPGRRFSSATALAADLRHYLNHEPIESRHVGRVERGLLWVKRKPALAFASGLALAAILAAVGFLITHELSKTAFIEQLQRQNATKEIESATREGLDAHRPVSALFHYLRALEEASGKDTDLQRVARLNLADWHNQILKLEQHSRVPVDRASSAMPEADLAGAALAISDSVGKLYLWQKDRASDDVQLLMAGLGQRTFAFSLDGKLVAAIKNGLHIYEVNNGVVSNRTKVPIHGEPDRLCFSPDGQFLAIAANSALHVYDRIAGRLHHLANIQGTARQLCFVSNNSIITLTGPRTSSKLELWTDWRKPASRQHLYNVAIPINGRISVAISPVGLAAIPHDKQLSIVPWPPNPAASSIKIQLSGELAFCSFSPDGSTLATVVDQNQVQLWDTKSGHALCDPQFYRQRIHSVLFHPDGKSLYLTADDFSLRLLRLPLRPTTTLNTGKSTGCIRFLQFSESGHLLMASKLGSTSSSNSLIQFWKMPECQPINLPLAFWAFIAPSLSADARRIAYAQSRSIVEVRDMDHGTVLARLQARTYFTALFWTHDCTTLYAGDGDGDIHFFETDTGRRGVLPSSNAGDVTSLAVSPDDQLLLVGTQKGKILVWDRRSTKNLYTIIDQTSSSASARIGINAAIFSPKGDQFATASKKEVRIRQTSNGSFHNRILEHDAKVNRLAWDKNANLVVTGSDDGSLKIWNGATGKPIGMPIELGSPVYGVAFSPDGLLILTMCSSGKTNLWDSETHHAVGKGLEMNDGVYATAMSPDGNFVATGDRKGAIRIWPLPKPVQGDVARLRLWIQVLTGMQDDPAFGGLDLSPTDWAEKKRQLDALGGPPLP
jgi:WD40 repeat protein